MFLKMNIDVLDVLKNWKDNNGTNILMWSCYYNYYELAELCLNLGVDKNYRNNYGSTAYEFANDTRPNYRITELINKF